MTKVVLISLFIFFFTLPLFAQSVDTAWVRRYARYEFGQDAVTSIAVDGSGNVYVTGLSYDNLTLYDYATIKYHPNGDTAWIRRYNGPANSSDYAYGIALDSSRNIYVTGQSYGTGTSGDYATIKYLQNGDTAWVRRYNGTGNGLDGATALALDPSGNIYVTGYSLGDTSYYDYVTIKYYPNGDTAWVRRYNGTADSSDFAYAIAVDNSGNAYVTGSSDGTGTLTDYVTIKYDSNGDTVWVKRYNGPGNYEDFAYAIGVDSLRSVYVTGASTGSGTLSDYATIKYIATGDTAWVRRYDGPGDSADEASDLVIDNAGNIYVTGGSTGIGSGLDYATIKYSPAGDTAWVRRYNGPGNSDDVGLTMALDNSGNLYVTGQSYGNGTFMDYATIKYYPGGDTAWVERYNGPGNYWDDAYAIAVDNSGKVYVAGESFDAVTWFDYATIKYVQPTSVGDENEGSSKPDRFVLSQNYPNPFNLTTTIPYQAGSRELVAGRPIRTSLKIYNILGQLLRTLVDEEKTPGNYKVIWDGKDNSGKEVGSGIYFYQLKAGEFSESRKLVLLK